MIPISAASSAAISPVGDGEVSRRASSSIACAARSSSRNSPIPSSTAAARHSWCASVTRPARRPRHRRRLCGGARQLRHDRAQQRDRCTRQQDFRQPAARALRAQCRISCSTAWSGSCAMSSSSRGLAGIVEHYRARHRRGREALDARAARGSGCRCKARETSSPERCAGGVGAPDRAPADARSRPGYRHVADRSGREIAAVAAIYFAAEAFFRLDQIVPRRAASSFRIISTGWRSTARSIPSARPSGGWPRPWRGTAPRAQTRWKPGGRPQGRCRAGAHVGQRDRRLGPYAGKANCGGEPGGRLVRQ